MFYFKCVFGVVCGTLLHFVWQKSYYNVSFLAEYFKASGFATVSIVCRMYSPNCNTVIAERTRDKKQFLWSNLSALTYTWAAKAWFYRRNNSVLGIKNKDLGPVLFDWPSCFGTKPRFQIMFQGRHAHIRDKRQLVVYSVDTLKSEKTINRYFVPIALTVYTEVHVTVMLRTHLRCKAARC